MWPRLGTSKLIERWILVVLGASIVAAVDGGWLAYWTALVPARVWHGEVWRLVTWPFVQARPLALILTCATIYKFGGELAPRWGDRRLQRFVAEIAIAAAAVTCVVATVIGIPHLSHHGGWAFADMLVIAWARQYPTSTVVLYGMVTLRGQDLVRMTIGITVVFAMFLGVLAMAPELAACSLAAVYPGDRLRR